MGAPFFFVIIASPLQIESNPALLTNLGAAYLDVKYYDLALEPLQTAVAIAPGLSQAHNNLGIVLAELGDTSGARREFETALMLDPENESVKFNLGKPGGQNEE